MTKDKQPLPLTPEKVREIIRQESRGVVTFKYLITAIALAATVIGSLVLWYVNSHIPTAIKSELAPTNERVAKIESKIDSANERFAQLESQLSLVLRRILKETATGTPNEVQVKMVLAKNILSEAEKQDVVLDPPLIVEGGQSILMAELNHPELAPIAWDTATQFVAYRSFLNAKLYPFPVSGIIAGPNGGVRGKPPCCGHFESMFIDGGTNKLDWLSFTNVLFRNCTIEYDGNPLILNNVHFENCKFQIAKNENGKKFAQALLLNPASTLDTQSMVKNFGANQILLQKLGSAPSS
jgi:hypothetical protein